MAAGRLDGMRIAIIVTDDFEQVEMTDPRRVLEQEGAAVTLISTHRGEVHATQHHVRADKFHVDLLLKDAGADNFDALVLPGGVVNADHLRMETKAREFARQIDESDKPMAIICHAPWLLVSAGLVSGRDLTSWPTLQDDIRNAGGRWLNLPVVKDRNLVTSRGPHDLPAFNRAMIDLFS